MGSMSIWHWIVVIAVVLLLFGRGKISELMGDVAQGIKSFKKGMSEDDTAKTETPASDPKTINHQATPAQPAATTTSSTAAGAAGAQQRS
jgi:sec-independent protein translocase protein TatA